MAVEYLAVGGYLVAGAHAQDVAELHVIDGDFTFAAVGIHAQRSVRLQLDQFADGFAGLALGPFFHVATEQDEGADAGSRFEIDVVVHFQHAGNAVGPGGAGTNGNQRVHVRFALPGQRPGFLEDAVAAAEQNDAGECKFHHAQCRRFMHQHARNHDGRSEQG